MPHSVALAMTGSTRSVNATTHLFIAFRTRDMEHASDLPQRTTRKCKSTLTNLLTFVIKVQGWHESGYANPLQNKAYAQRKVLTRQDIPSAWATPRARRFKASSRVQIGATGKLSVL